jgi:parvulin-like peptidyl-prolyl isomerase
MVPRRNGGDLGWTNPGIFVPEFEDAVSELQPGQKFRAGGQSGLACI